MGSGALLAACGLPHFIVEFFSRVYQPVSRCHDSAHGRLRMAPAFDCWVSIDKQANSYTLWMPLFFQMETISTAMCDAQKHSPQ